MNTDHLSSTQKLVLGSVYRHYKGNTYRVRAIARHSETLEELVFYEALYENPLGQFWVRPKEMFLSDVELDGQFVPRFKFVEN